MGEQYTATASRAVAADYGFDGVEEVEFVIKRGATNS